MQASAFINTYVHTTLSEWIKGYIHQQPFARLESRTVIHPCTYHYKWAYTIILITSIWSVGPINPIVNSVYNWCKLGYLDSLRAIHCTVLSGWHATPLFQSHQPPNRTMATLPKRLKSKLCFPSFNLCYPMPVIYFLYMRHWDELCQRYVCGWHKQYTKQAGSISTSMQILPHNPPI